MKDDIKIEETMCVEPPRQAGSEISWYALRHTTNTTTLHSCSKSNSSNVVAIVHVR